MRLSDAEFRTYVEHGCVFPIRVLDEPEAAVCRERLERAEAEGGEVRRSLRHKPHLLFTFLNELVRHPRMLDPVEDVLGPDLFCWGSSVFTKEANSPSFFSWHQDLIYWGLEPADVVTAWVALSQSTPESGAIRYIPGSHEMDVVTHKETFAEGNMLSRGQRIELEVDASRAVDVGLQAGEMSLHHVKLIHSSGPNRSSQRRIGLSIRYIPTYVRQVAGEKESALLVRGEDAYGHFEHEQPPAADFDPEAVERHRVMCERQRHLLPPWFWPSGLS